ncbi:MAG: hypothetical protein ACP5JG_07085, partial [Anaerolineae bacterium]
MAKLLQRKIKIAGKQVPLVLAVVIGSLGVLMLCCIGVLALPTPSEEPESTQGAAPSATAEIVQPTDAATATEEATETSAAAPTETPMPTATAEATETASVTDTAAPTVTPTQTAEATETAVPTETAAPTATATATSTPEPTVEVERFDSRGLGQTREVWEAAHGEGVKNFMG